MADPHTLKIGDTVTHPDWLEGTRRTVVALAPFARISRSLKGRTKLVDDPEEVIARLNEPVTDFEGGVVEPGDDMWMEAGLVLVDDADDAEHGKV